jgi:hypothetical protein
MRIRPLAFLASLLGVASSPVDRLLNAVQRGKARLSNLNAVVKNAIGQPIKTNPRKQHGTFMQIKGGPALRAGIESDIRNLCLSMAARKRRRGYKLNAEAVAEFAGLPSADAARAALGIA